MKKTILTAILCLSAAWPSFAQNNIEAMRFLTVNSLMQYGLTLYDRGDYDQASAVFNHVLKYDSHQAQALQYLHDMGYSPGPHLVRKIDVSDTEKLQQAVEAKKKSIARLRDQIIQIRANIASQSLEE